MSEMTPETLRNFPTRVRWGQTVAVMTKAQVDAAADAWEDDLKRLEAAEKVCRNAIARRHDLEGEIMGGYDSEMDAALDEWAALAAEEAT